MKKHSTAPFIPATSLWGGVLFGLICCPLELLAKKSTEQQRMDVLGHLSEEQGAGVVSKFCPTNSSTYKGQMGAPRALEVGG